MFVNREILVIFDEHALIENAFDANNHTDTLVHVLCCLKKKFGPNKYTVPETNELR